jgi:hypothetical protein
MIFAPILLERVMSETLESMQKRAREFARSGKFASWRAVVFELQFEPSLQEAFRRKYLYWPHDASEDAFLWLHNPATKAEIDELCREARNPSNARMPRLPENQSALTPKVERGLGSMSP